MKYCVDANFFISLWRRYFSVDIVPSFWTWLEKRAREGILLVPEEVFEEIIVNKDGLSLWLTSVKKYVLYSLNNTVQDALLEIISLPGAILLVDSNKKKHGADIFLIAYAKAYNATVVSDDTGVEKLCKDCGVRSIKYHDFLKEQRLKMTIID